MEEESLTAIPSDRQKHRFIYNYESERQNKIRAVLILFISIIIFILTAVGLTNGLSEMTSSFLVSNLGYTNEWSSTYGSEIWVRLNQDVAALAGDIILLIFTSIIIIYFLIRKKNRRLSKFLFVVVGGGFVLLIVKIIFAKELPEEPHDLLLKTISTYPSGHAMMGTIFYLTLATFVSRAQHSGGTKKFTITAAVILVFLIGISRFLAGGHTLTEVLAGWSLGLIWLCFCWYSERFIKKYKSENRMVA